MNIIKMERMVLIVLLGIIAMNTAYDDSLFLALKFLVGAYCLLMIWEAIKDFSFLIKKKKKD